MKSRSRSSAPRSALRHSTLALALGLCFAGGVQAQTNTAGAISGQANSGDTITVVNPSTGFSRTITAGADGNYRFSALPTGNYQVSRNGGAARSVKVNVGTATSVDFIETLDAVEVVGGSINPIDVSSVESSTVLTAEQIAKIPVIRNATDVALLAPGTVRGDAVYGNLASFGGSSVAENAYYVNGFNITNTFNNLNFAQIPFEGIAEQQVKTGGYGAEFGRSTGGVINMITRRGTNEFKAGGNVYWTPSALRGSDPNVFSNGGQPATGSVVPSQMIANNSRDDYGTQVTANVWAGGALVQDKVFGYALVSWDQITGQSSYPFATSGAPSFDQEDKSPNWLAKLDWNINDDNLLEFTAFSDKTKTEQDYWRTGQTSLGSNLYNAGAALTRESYLGRVYDERGGTSYVAKYTGYLTDSFTLSALYGHGEQSRSNYAIAANGLRAEFGGDLNTPATGCPIVTDSRTNLDNTGGARIAGCNFVGTLGRPDAKDTRDQYRIDAEWQAGDHLLRFGFERDDFESIAGQSYEGGAAYLYLNDEDFQYVRLRRFVNGATVGVLSDAFYLEDTWNITNNFLLYAGIRWDKFENTNGLGEKYVSIDDQLGPRLGLSWDVFGDSTFKVFANAGRYALPLTATVAVRGASASLFSEQYFTYTGVDPSTGAPTGLDPISNISYLNNEFGTAKNPNAVTSGDLKPMYQDEYILGFQKQLTDHMSLGVRGIYRDLSSGIDDTCDWRPVRDWGLRNGFVLGEDGNPFITVGDKESANQMAFLNPGFAGCRLYNPGRAATFQMDVNGDGVFENVALTAEELGQKAKRTYKAVEIFAEGHWDKFFIQGSYTWAKSLGNSEGGVNSNLGQADTGTTVDFDYPELMYGAYGYLPNDRRHSLKLFGNYELNDQWSVGANLLVQSGRPVSCIGVYGNDPTGYQNNYYSCSPNPGVVVTSPGTGGPVRDNGTTLVPRGTYARTPWTRTLDLNVAWRPAFADGHLTVKADVFNVFNEHGATSMNEFAENSAGSQRYYLAFNTPATFQAPRSVRLMLQYDW
ncbi:Oar protein [Lysobacter dokdonensis DS-58]|uniref:Oar protein n=1 Tax=Lysobacter dokdonensis DS-58 TaxID=1300345 RepID=A0A0A2WG64_9GAMM|nr:TonB-dependent receptor [Lysobacter dokdonensis]KGQ18788.1 Oar protein [Lysobacter dokdonensis DS-58]